VTQPFGDQLRRAREARGVSLDTVSDATRIAQRHLEALERSDLGGLPRGPFGRGYIRAYAGFLGIDPRPILEAYGAQELKHGLGPSDTQRRTLDELSQLVQQRASAQHRGPAAAKLAALALVALAVLGGTAWILVGRAPESDVATSLPPAGGHSPGEGRSSEASSESGEARGAPAPTTQGVPRAPGPPGAVAPATERPTGGLRISHSGVGTGVEDHRLVGRADRFVAGTEVSFWTRVLGGEPGGVIRHVWIHDDRVAMKVDLPIGGSHWRTFSRLRLPGGAIGPWTVEARDADGRLLAREEFLCVAESP
jgi:transcriptional regulator with XRE-family HTH domain